MAITSPDFIFMLFSQLGPGQAEEGEGEEEESLEKWRLEKMEKERWLKEQKIDEGGKSDLYNCALVGSSHRCQL